MAVVKAVGYTPNRGAQRLASRRTRDVGFLFTRPFDHPFFGKMAATISRVLHAADYHLEIANEPFWVADDDEPIRRLVTFGVNAMVVGPQYGKKEADALAAMDLPDIPMLVFGEHAAGRCDVIRGDLVETGRMIGKLLRKYGHERVGFFGAEESDEPYLECNPKLDGLMQSLGGEENVPPDWCIPQPKQETVEELYPLAREAAQRLKAWAPDARPTAFCCQNDRMAMILIGALRERGFAIPHDLSVVGCDNIYASEFFLPPLTTVDQDLEAMVKLGMEQLLGRLEGRSGPWGEVMSLPPRLIERASVATPPAV
jgi:DNA-binding LacI/PurR family transcriptional regulator